MNANDIIKGLAEANEIDEYGQFGRTVEALLRQQQAEIEELKAQIAELTEQNDAYYEESGKTYD